MVKNPVFLLFIFITSVSPISSYSKDQSKFILGEDNLGRWKNGMLSSSAASEAPGPANGPPDPLVLAGSRTKRPDILNHFKLYRGGWDITNKHYWASVGFTGAVEFILAILWFVCFGLAMIIHHCCRWRIDIKDKESRGSQRICLILLIVFTCASVIGCILLSVGQDEFHGEAVKTLNYVVNQSDYTVQTLANVTAYLSLAKTVNVAQVFLPSDVKDDIDRLTVELNNAADTLRQKTQQNSRKIRTVFDTVRLSMIAVAVVMLLDSFLGLFLSILGHKNTIYIFITSGWLLVVVTFILCGVFVIINHAIADTCMAMGQWVDNQQAETALSNILPCVDEVTTNATLYKSKLVVNDIANIINGFIGSFANSNAPPSGNSNYYNQSGPLMPYVCYPYDSQLHELECPSQLVSMANASMVWQNYTCSISESGFCTTTGRLTPDMYRQLVGAANISYGLQHYTPPLLSLQDCNFVRQTFRIIISDHCPPLEDHLRLVNAGLALVSVGVMLSLALWIIYANRPQGGQVFDKFSSKFIGRSKGDTAVDVALNNNEV
ncbi:putative transmembrane protein [Helianthus debilis subsp. tardiflorus]